MRIKLSCGVKEGAQGGGESTRDVAVYDFVLMDQYLKKVGNWSHGPAPSGRG